MICETLITITKLFIICKRCVSSEWEYILPNTYMTKEIFIQGLKGAGWDVEQAICPDCQRKEEQS